MNCASVNMKFIYAQFMNCLKIETGIKFAEYSVVYGYK